MSDKSSDLHYFVDMIGKHSIYIILFFIGSYILAKNNWLAKIFVIVAPLFLYFILGIKFRDQDLFAKVKALSVFIPVLLYTWHDYFSPRFISKNTLLLILQIVLAVNIFEFGYLIDFKSEKPLSKANSIFIIALALLTPQLIIKNGIIGFDNIWWAIGYSIILGSTHFFGERYYKNTYKFAGIYSITMPTVYSLITGSTQMWLPLRVYSLILSFILNYGAKNIQNDLSNSFYKVYNLIDRKFDEDKALSVFLGFIIIIIITVKKITK